MGFLFMRSIAGLILVQYRLSDSKANYKSNNSNKNANTLSRI